MADDIIDGQHDYSVIYGTLANFLVEKKIGKGQFSEVYKAKCSIDTVTLALKKVQVRLLMLILCYVNFVLRSFYVFAYDTIQDFVWTLNLCL